MSGIAARVALKTDIVVVGAGQAGLSSAYHLKGLGVAPGRGFVVLDQNAAPGGAWQHRWPSLTLSTVNRIHDLPGMAFADALPDGGDTVEAAVAVPRYFAAYETAFELPVYRPVIAKVVCERAGRLRVETDREGFSARHHQRHRHMGDAVHPRLSRPRAVRGAPTPHPRLQVGG